MRCVNFDSSPCTPLFGSQSGPREKMHSYTLWSIAFTTENYSCSYYLRRRLRAWQQIASQPPLNVGNSSSAIDTRGQVLTDSKEPRGVLVIPVPLPRPVLTEIFLDFLVVWINDYKAGAPERLLIKVPFIVKNVIKWCLDVSLLWGGGAQKTLESQMTSSESDSVNNPF